jgi:23S rRNA pseudouridine1911/1915/1917 synthase
MTLLDWLIARFPTAKRTTLRRMLESGRVRINGLSARTMKMAVREGDDVQVIDRVEAEPRTRASRLPFTIVHEDDDVLVIDKPPGLLTSTVPREPRPTALAAVTEYLARTSPESRVGLIHRLDRDASGLLVFSKNPAAFRSLKQQFFEHTVERIYHALVQGVPNPRKGRIESRLVELRDGSVHTTRRSNHGEPAITEFTTIRWARNHGVSLVRVKLHTGRKHQIRAHLSERGTPIINDPMYGNPPRRRAGRLMLVATELSFDHPRTGKRVKFEFPLPKEMTRPLTP